MKISGTLIGNCRWDNSPSKSDINTERRLKRKVCSNVLCATAEQPETPSVNYIEISIEDTGNGISADRLLHIFDRFYRTEGSRSPGYKGIGIGLALVKELVHSHKGSIGVTSLEGQGTTFTVRLPLGKNRFDAHEIVEESDFTARAHRQSLRHADMQISENILPMLTEIFPETEQKEGIDDTIILVIENNADMRAYLCGHLEPAYKTIEAKDGEEGLERALEIIPDLIISDVMMPKKDGYQLCRALKTDERTSHIPVILLTGKTRDENKLTGLETGADAYVIKPFSPKELDVRVKNLIEVRRKLREQFNTATHRHPDKSLVTSISGASIDQKFLKHVTAAIEAHLQDEQFGLEQLAASVGMSPSQLHRKLRAIINQSPGKLLRSMRLQRAADLLKQKSSSVAEITYAVGFGSQSHFTKMFGKEFGCTPTEYQKR